MAQKKKPAKDRVKAKAKEVKAKVKGKVKALLALIGLAVLTGCMTPEQASRSTAATVGDVSIENSIAEIKGSPRGSADKACACADKCCSDFTHVIGKQSGMPYNKVSARWTGRLTVSRV